MDVSAKEFLEKVIADYNAMFKTSFSLESKSFENYYRDLSNRVKNQEVDLLIVVGMFLTGFDAPMLNTLFVDKNLRYHGLLQAYSRTNRIYNSTKSFGNIVTFRDLEQATIDAITLFGDKSTKNVILEKSYQEYLEGFTDIITGKACRGYNEIVKELKEQFPDPDEIHTTADKKAFVKLFGEYLQVENILQNYDEFAHLKALQTIDKNDPEALKAFAEEHFLTEEQVTSMVQLEVLKDRLVQDYKSTYNDIRDWVSKERENKEQEKQLIDWEEVVFEVDLLKSQEIDTIDDKPTIIAAFFTYAQERQKTEAAELIAEENLNEEAAKRYIQLSLKREYASENGTDLNSILPKMSPLNPQYRTKKQSVLRRIAAFVEKYKGVGGEL